MLFNSVEFLIFFPLVTLLYFVLPHPARWGLLLAASCVFYMFFKPVYILILAFTIVIDYFAGIWLENEQDTRKKRLLLLMSLLANIGVLAVFKYYNFINANIMSLASLLGVENKIPMLEILLPIGLSFHTFQAMSYTIEVYRGHQKAERHFGIYSLYVMFYPQLVAGPIERPQNLIHQFHERHQFSYRNAVDGLTLMLWGMFKKVVVADQFAPIADQVFNHPHDFTAAGLVIGVLAFSIQIYGDFSGYSDIAIGSAQVMGFKLMTNFNTPYFSRSIAEFWKRWHISLSTWFRDYLYISLGGNRVAVPRWYFNLFIVFLISGLWHGASWTYVVWGGLHGFYLVFGLATKSVRDRIAAATGFARLGFVRSLCQTSCTCFLVGLAWVFFRAKTFSDAMHILGGIFGNATLLLHPAAWKEALVTDLGVSIWDFRALAIALAALLGVETVLQKVDLLPLLARFPRPARWAVRYGLIFLIVQFGMFGSHQFIYFQF